ncbi:hypothetical protein HYH03_002341 [Edaphochlamys debaryana]|uniref:Uncharacterized protein n=1 Tax=Edaphochlamys debaryana TaxID=47281 RepID=A0A836C5P3_9CHLO|nr:hypothetical protein HYH03_002341 [Edaphochlamys debaryana]|eukprot:KAG2500064.1 hypothetical protein HYH03_002341 [Edaphochlamys debaryana]
MRRSRAYTNAEKALTEVTQGLASDLEAQSQTVPALLELFTAAASEADTFRWLIGQLKGAPLTFESLTAQQPSNDFRRDPGRHCDYLIRPVAVALHHFASVVHGYIAATWQQPDDEGRAGRACRAIAALWDPALLCAEAQALRGVARYFGVRGLASSTDTCMYFVRTCAYLTVAVMTLLVNCRNALLGPVQGLVEGLGGAELPPVAAEMRGDKPSSDLATTVHDAAKCFLPALGYAQAVHCSVWAGHVTTSAATAALAAALSHPDMLRMQALVERVCVHGGVGLEDIRRSQEPAQDQGEPSAGPASARAEAPSGAAARPRVWWLPALEAEVGHVIGGSVQGDRNWHAASTAGWL